jgi:hypothetical protein
MSKAVAISSGTEVQVIGKSMIDSSYPKLKKTLKKFGLNNINRLVEL